MRVLIIEDDAAWAKLLRYWVAHVYGDDAHVVGARTIAEAELELGSQWDLIVMDYWLDGGATAEALLRSGGRSDLPVVLVTGREPKVTADLAAELGVAWADKGSEHAERKVKEAFEEVVPVTRRARSKTRVAATTTPQKGISLGQIASIVPNWLKVLAPLVVAGMAVIGFAVGVAINIGVASARQEQQETRIVTVETRQIQDIAARAAFETKLSTEIAELRGEVRAVLNLPALRERK